MLVHFDPDKPITLAADASTIGLRAVISHEVDGDERAIAFALRSLSHTKRNYTQIERETLAIIFGVLYIKSMHNNKPLAFILGPKKGIPSIAASRIQ